VILLSSILKYVFEHLFTEMKLLVSIDILMSLVAGLWKCFCSTTGRNKVCLEEDAACSSFEATRNAVESTWGELVYGYATKMAEGYVKVQVFNRSLPHDEEGRKRTIREHIVSTLRHDEDRDANLLSRDALTTIVEAAIKQIPAAEAKRDKPPVVLTTHPNKLAAQMHDIKGKIKKRKRAGKNVGIAAPMTVAASKQINMMLEIRKNEKAVTLNDIPPSRLIALRWTMGLGAKAFKYLWNQVKSTKFVSSRVPTAMSHRRES